jgi:hypothetical protein
MGALCFMLELQLVKPMDLLSRISNSILKLSGICEVFIINHMDNFDLWDYFFRLTKVSGY